MKRKYKNMAAVTMAATMACAAYVKGGTVIGAWQNTSLITDRVSNTLNGSNDGWFDWTLSNGGSAPTSDPGSDPTDDFPTGSSTTYTTYNPSTTTGVTLGMQSLQMTTAGGYSQNLSLKTQNETDSEGNSEIADFFNNTEFTIHVTYNANEWSSTAGVESGLTINAQTYGFQNQPVVEQYNTIGPPNYDTGNSGTPGNWDAADYASPSTNGITTRTMTFSYANMLPGGSGNPNAVSSSDPTGTIPANATYVELIMATIRYSDPTFGSLYISDAQFTNAPVTTTWQAQQHPQGTSYNWGTINNFTPYSQATLTGGMPCNPGDTVTFGTNIPGGITETIDLNENADFQISVGTMIFNNPGSSYLIDQGTGGTLTLNGNTINPASSTPTPGLSTIAVESGNHTISAPVALATNTTASITSGSVFTISGNIGGASGLTVGASTYTNGGGTLALSGLNTYSGGTTVTTGVLEILPTVPASATASALPTGAVTLSGSGVLQLATNVTLGSHTSPTPSSNVNITSLSIMGNGTLDINNNHIIINYGTGSDPIASIAAYVKSGYANGAWTGTGITSSAAKANSGSYGIGYADAADPGNPAGLASGQIEIMYTLLGDANLDGAVNGSDFAILASNFNKAVSGWDAGDFNYDGAANGSDFAALASNFNKGASQAADATALDSFAAANGLLTSVPEPASAGLLAMGVISVLARRRSRSGRFLL